MLITQHVLLITYNAPTQAEQTYDRGFDSVHDLFIFLLLLFIIIELIHSTAQWGTCSFKAKNHSTSRLYTSTVSRVVCLYAQPCTLPLCVPVFLWKTHNFNMKTVCITSSPSSAVAVPGLPADCVGAKLTVWCRCHIIAGVPSTSCT